ncbi:enterochelin esterase domain-containing protein, partial [Citrobacter amalonaticus]|uniref:enterochelin esterase domain-containing protein n=1 Tax=Citrobacter amalonaticus TaxID=35703 RepID=UPI0012D43A45
MTVTALTVGSEAWWQSKNGPQWTREADGNYRVTFWWRDPQGSEFHSAIQRVWVYITGVTDHHQNVFPQTMQRIAGTDVWQWQTVLSANWRGSYCFIPSTQEESFASLKTDGVLDRTALREGWRQL